MLQRKKHAQPEIEPCVGWFFGYPSQYHSPRHHPHGSPSLRDPLVPRQDLTSLLSQLGKRGQWRPEGTEDRGWDLRDSQDEGTWIKGHGHDGHVPKLEFVGYCWTKWGLIRHRDGMMELGMLDHNAFPQVLLECVESMNLSILDLDKFGSLVILNLNLRSN